MPPRNIYYLASDINSKRTFISDGFFSDFPSCNEYSYGMKVLYDSYERWPKPWITQANMAVLLTHKLKKG